MKEGSSVETEIVGEVRDVLYENSENGYAVIRLRVKGSPAPIVVTGSLFGVVQGIHVKVVGSFKEHPRFGRQLNVVRHEEVMPRSRLGMEGFIASQFKGVGEKLAHRIVEFFGDETYTTLDRDPGAVKQVPGVGKKKAAAISSQWESRKGIREASTFLQGHGVGPAQVARLFRHYGNATVGLVRTSPYRLADDIRGIGFRTADRIAMSLGIPKGSPERARAAILYVLGESKGQGHLLLPMEELVQRTQMLEIEEDTARTAVAELAEERFVVVEDTSPDVEATRVVLDQDGAGWDRQGPVVYLLASYSDECLVAELLKRRAVVAPAFPDVSARVEAAARKAGLDNAPEQIEAVKMALTHRVSVITGGPGVGKTTIVRLLADLLGGPDRGGDGALVAPTGRAAKRLSEAAGRPASTIHRLLHFEPFTGAFAHDEHEPVPVDHVVVDECSMLDVPLAASLLRALPDHARLTLVGDADQLPSVGPGDFFRAVVASDAVPVIRLTRVFRQREGSRIVAGAHAVNQGRFPDFDPPGAGGEFFFVEKDDPEAVAEMIRSLVVERIPEVYGLDPRLDVQVLSPMHKGASGAENLNAVLGEALNPNPAGSLTRRGRTLRTGDRVVQIKNDYENNIFNGDQGFVESIDPGPRRLLARIDDRIIRYDFEQLSNLLPAWTTTVHRSQGGEHRAIVLSLTGQHFPLLKRNLLYTAITRAKSLCVIVGSRRALERAISDRSASDRYSWLEERLRAMALGESIP